MSEQSRKRLVRFGSFELDLDNGELRRQGVKLHLQPKPMQMLQVLVERPGEVVTREDLRHQLWGDGTFVDFESSLNTAANRLRVRLGDSVEYPRYIETLPRAGYRFIAPVEKVEWEAPATQTSNPAEGPAPAKPVKGRFAFTASVAVVTAVFGVLVGYFIFLSHPVRNAHFRQLTFRPGKVLAARFAPDGHAVIYTAQWDGEPRQLFLTSAVAPESRLLGFQDLTLESVSRLGELALLRTSGTSNIAGGKLSRVPMNGGSPLLVDQAVTSAEWAPDSRTLAVVRATGGSSQLEFPSGKPLYRTSGWLSNLRFSPSGNEIAFLEHPVRHDNSGSVKLINRKGGVETVSEGWASITGLAWHPSGKELWFSGARDGEPRSIWAATRAGKLRAVAPVPGLTLRDIAPDGRALVSRETRRLEMAGRIPGDSPEREFTWLDWSRVADVTPDRRFVLFDESGEAAGPHSLVYILNTLDRTTVRLSEGIAMAASPDGRYALIASEDRRHLRLIPIAGGAARDLPDSGLIYQWAKLFPDGGRLLVLGHEPHEGLRLYVRPLTGSTALPISPEIMVRNAAISPDGKRLAVLSGDRLILLPTQGGTPQVIPTSEPLAPLRWRSREDSIYVQHMGAYTELPARISLLRVPDGKLTLWKEIMPADRMGVDLITGIIIAADERAYVYSYRRVLSELYSVEGW